jgi:hypothetical protein
MSLRKNRVLAVTVVGMSVTGGGVEAWLPSLEQSSRQTRRLSLAQALGLALNISSGSVTVHGCAG